MSDAKNLTLAYTDAAYMAIEDYLKRRELTDQQKTDIKAMLDRLAMHPPGLSSPELDARRDAVINAQLGTITSEALAITEGNSRIVRSTFGSII